MEKYIDFGTSNDFFKKLNDYEENGEDTLDMSWSKFENDSFIPIHRFTPIDGDDDISYLTYKDIPKDSDLKVIIKIPDSKERDYIGCIMGKQGTTITLIQKMTETIIKFEYVNFNNQIKIIPKNNNSNLDHIIKCLNKAYNIIITVIKLKHIEPYPNTAYSKLALWQNDENKIITETQKLINTYLDLGVDPDFINKSELKSSVEKNLKKTEVISKLHDSDNIEILNLFIKNINIDITHDCFTQYYNKLVEKYFSTSNILIRGMIIINNELEINFKNYSNLYYEINDYYRTKIIDCIIKKTNSTKIYRSDSCKPFNYESTKTNQLKRPNSTSFIKVV
jgi:hypothetical protein